MRVLAEKGFLRRCFSGRTKTGIPVSSVYLCLGLCLLAGILFTWPLGGHFFSSIPYTLKPLSGFEQVPLMPGDHLQTYYWFWLLSDNLWGNSALFSNPYEFNGPAGPMSTVYANFPFSILYVLLLPLGPIGAYNGLIFLSFLFSGLAVFLLAWTWTRDSWASLLAGLIFAVVPYRVSHIAGGQLYGYVIFLLPLCLFFLEQTLNTGRWVYGGLTAFCLLLMSLMEPHTTFLTALTLGIYFPSRILLIRPQELTYLEEKKPSWPGLLGALGGGLSWGLFVWMVIGRRQGLPFLHPDLIQSLLIWMISAILTWFYLSALMARWTTLSYAGARNRVGGLFSFFLLLLLYGVQYRIAMPRLGLILVILSVSCFFGGLLRLWKVSRDRVSGFNRSAIWVALIGIGIGLMLALAYLMHIRTAVFLPSLAGKGRTVHEVLLFSPKAGNLFFWLDINRERFVLLGWGLLILAAFGILLLFKNQPKKFGYLALAGILAFLGIILTVGPTLPYLPLYQLLYSYLPFFNYPRVPGRFVMIGILFLSLLAALFIARLRSWLEIKNRRRLQTWVPVVLILLILTEYHTFQPLGLSLMEKTSEFTSEIARLLPPGQRVLELPLWPGDSHQSSVYEYNVTRTRKPMINGYAPVVRRDYVEKVFWPLYPLDHGELAQIQIQTLKELKVGLVTFHDNASLYTQKISPFPPSLTLRRLSASGLLEPVTQDKEVTLFKFQTDPDPGNRFPMISSPVQAVFYAHDLGSQTGQWQWDRRASGFYLLLQEGPLKQGLTIPKTGVKGNIIEAVPGRDQPGYLIFGPPRFLPSGHYLASFRLKAGSIEGKEPLGRIEVVKDNNVLERKLLSAKDFPAPETWTDVPLAFYLDSVSKVEFRVYFDALAPLAMNLIRVRFADQTMGPGAVEAEDLFRQTGQIIPDPLASGKRAVLGQAGYHPPIYLTHGPYHTFEPGQYRIRFYLRSVKEVPSLSEKVVARLEVATDMGKYLFKERRVVARELSPDRYRPFEMEFQVPFRCEVDYRVQFQSQIDLLVDRIEVLALESGKK